MSGYALRFISGKYQGNEYPLKKGEEVVIGRGSDIAITLVEDMISRRHARIVVEDDYIVLEDLGSTNGSFVNGERVRKVRIKEGDRILLGTSIIKLVSAEGDNFPDSPSTPSQAGMKAPGLPAPGLPSPGLPSPGLPAPGLPKPAPAPPSLSIGGGQSRGGSNTATMAAPAFNMGSVGAPPPSFSAPKPPGLPTPGRPAPFGTPSSDAMSAPPPPGATSGSMSSLSAVPKPALGVPSAPPSLSFDAPSAPRGFGAPSPALPKPAPMPAAAPPPAFGAPAMAAPASESLLPPPNGPAIMEGDLQEMPLGDLFDIFVNSRRNGVLLVRGPLDGHLHFRDGRIAFAELGTEAEVHPSKAAMRIVGWSNGSYALYPPNDQVITEYIDEDPLELLQRAKRQQDELKRYKADLPPGTKRLSIPRPLEPLLSELRPEQLDIFQLILNHQNIESVVIASNYSEAETYQSIVHLLRQQYVQAG